MSKVLRGMGTVLKWGFVAVLFIGNIIADLIGIIVCAITSEGQYVEESRYAAAESAEKL